MDKQTVVYPYNWILFTNKKEWNNDKCHNIVRCWKLYAKWEKLFTEDFMYKKCL